MYAEWRLPEKPKMKATPIVLYNGDRFLGVRFPWDVPVEDYLFGFALVTLVMLLWDRAGRTVGER